MDMEVTERVCLCACMWSFIKAIPREDSRSLTTKIVNDTTKVTNRCMHDNYDKSK